MMFKQEEAKEIIIRAADALQQAVLYSIADSMIYGNWLYNVVSTVLVSNWLCFWCITCSNIPKLEGRVTSDKKTD